MKNPTWKERKTWFTIPLKDGSKIFYKGKNRSDAFARYRADRKRIESETEGYAPAWPLTTFDIGKVYPTTDEEMERAPILFPKHARKKGIYPRSISHNPVVNFTPLPNPISKSLMPWVLLLGGGIVLWLVLKNRSIGSGSHGFPPLNPVIPAYNQENK